MAGFGRGGTSIPFWENVYGFDMSCVGKEVVEDAAQLPIVDVIDSRDIVTNSVSLQVMIKLFFIFSYLVIVSLNGSDINFSKPLLKSLACKLNSGTSG